MAQHDMNIANDSFPAVRTDLNNAFAALNSMHSGTNRPSGAVVGTLWLDTTNSGSNSLEIKFFDGTDDISFATVDTSGASTQNIAVNTPTTIDSFTIASNRNVGMMGELTVNDGETITIGSGSKLVILN